MMIRGKTPAQLYSLVFGVGLVLTGLLGFPVDSSFTYGDHAHGHTLLLLEINGWHNALHFLVGALGLAAFRRPRLARAYAIGWGGTAALLAVWGFLTSYPMLGLIPADTGDNAFHVIDASIGILAWLTSAPSGRSSRPEASTSTGNTRPPATPGIP